MLTTARRCPPRARPRLLTSQASFDEVGIGSSTSSPSRNEHPLISKGGAAPRRSPRSAAARLRRGRPRLAEQLRRLDPACLRGVRCGHFQQRLARSFGDAVGIAMAHDMQVSGWYAPATNTHRAYAGRSFSIWRTRSGWLAGREVKVRRPEAWRAFLKALCSQRPETNHACWRPGRTNRRA